MNESNAVTVTIEVGKNKILTMRLADHRTVQVINDKVIINDSKKTKAEILEIIKEVRKTSKVTDIWANVGMAERIFDINREDEEHPEFNVIDCDTKDAAVVAIIEQYHEHSSCISDVMATTKLPNLSMEDVVHVWAHLFNKIEEDKIIHHFFEGEEEILGEW